MSVPRIAIGGVVRSWDAAERTRVNAAYVRSVTAAGGVPLLLSPLIGPSYAARALEGADGLVLTGGEDVDLCGIEGCRRLRELGTGDVQERLDVDSARGIPERSREIVGLRELCRAQPMGIHLVRDQQESERFVLW